MKAKGVPGGSGTAGFHKSESGKAGWGNRNKLLVEGFAAGSVNQGMNSLFRVPAELIFSK